MAQSLLPELTTFALVPVENVPSRKWRYARLRDNRADRMRSSNMMFANRHPKHVDEQIVALTFPLLYHPTCPEVQLSRRLAYNVDSAGLTVGWLLSVPAHIGHDVGINTAASCLNKGLQSITSDASKKDVEAACAVDYAKSIAALRLKLQDPQQCYGDSAILHVALLMFIDWGIMAPEGNAAASWHMQGLNALLLASSPRAAPSDLRRTMLVANWMGTFLVPVVQGVPSPFESRHWLEYDTKLNGSEHLAQLTRLYTHLFIRLPRLIALLRELRTGSNVSDVRQCILEVAIDCLRLSDKEAETNLLHIVGVKQTSDPALRDITKTSFRFKTRDDFWNAICYWQTRILANQAFLMVLDLNLLSSSVFNRQEIVDEIGRMATNLVMSWEYATSFTALAIVALRLGLIALWSAIPCMRSVEQGLLSADDMRRWVKQSYNTLYSQEGHFTEVDLDEAAELLMGGPLKGILVDFAISAQTAP